MRSEAKTAKEYLASLPADRSEALSKVRQIICDNLPTGYEEAMNWGMITYQVPLSVYPDTYNKQPLAYAALASQKNYMALYVSGPYGDEAIREKLEQGFKKAGKKLDMGKSCIRFKKLEDLPLDVVGEVIASVPMDVFIERCKK